MKTIFLIVVCTLLVVVFDSCTKYEEYEYFDYDHPVHIDFEYINNNNGTVTFINLSDFELTDNVSWDRFEYRWNWRFGCCGYAYHSEISSSNNIERGFYVYTFDEKKEYDVSLALSIKGTELSLTKCIKRIVVEDVVDFYEFTDSRDGKTYKYVKIGEQYWMAENLAYQPDSGNYWAYKNDTSYVKVYGYLYDQAAAELACPDGWHLPSLSEWNELIDYLGRDSLPYKLFAPNNQDYITNETGFSAEFSGKYNQPYDKFQNKGSEAYYWGSDCYTILNLSSIGHLTGNSEYGYSVRCVKD